MLWASAVWFGLHIGVHASMTGLSGQGILAGSVDFLRSMIEPVIGEMPAWWVVVPLFFVPGWLAAVALFAWLWSPDATDGELHCRRCGYILRGLSEPRCPECGEQI